MQKKITGTLKTTCCDISFIYNNQLDHKEFYVKNLNNLNTLKYEEFNYSQHDNLVDLLRYTKNLYIIESDSIHNHYVIREVKLGQITS